jgi:hypothetical protein
MESGRGAMTASGRHGTGDGGRGVGWGGERNGPSCGRTRRREERGENEVEKSMDG